jgi:repressor LexA
MHVIQQKLLRLIDSYNVAETPLREIAEIIGEKHPQIIKHHLEQLHKKGLVIWDKEKKVISRCFESVQTHRFMQMLMSKAT